MMIDNAITAYKAAVAAGFTGASLVTAVAIAGAESTFDPTRIGDEVLANEKWGPSVGLWQIRSLKNPSAWAYPDTLRDAEKLKDPLYNAKAAYAISKQGTDFSDWSTFVNGAYRQYEDIANEASTLFDTATKKNSTLLIIIVLIVVAYLLFK